MVGKGTEKAIKAWLALPKGGKFILARDETIGLFQTHPTENILKARFTIASIVAKRYSKRKKKVAK